MIKDVQKNNHSSYHRTSNVYLVMAGITKFSADNMKLTRSGGCKEYVLLIYKYSTDFQ